MLLKTEILSSDSYKEQSFFFNEHLKKFQKCDTVFLCKLFPPVNYLYVVDHKKVLLTILITSQTASHSLYILYTYSFSKLLPFVDYKKSLSHNTKYKLHNITNYFVQDNVQQKHSQKEHKSLTPKQKSITGKEKASLQRKMSHDK